MVLEVGSTGQYQWPVLAGFLLMYTCGMLHVVCTLSTNTTLPHTNLSNTWIKHLFCHYMKSDSVRGCENASMAGQASHSSLGER